MCLGLYLCEFAVCPSVCIYIYVSVLMLEYTYVCFHVSGFYLCCVFVRISPKMSGGVDMSISDYGVIWSGVLGALTCFWVIYEL